MDPETDANPNDAQAGLLATHPECEGWAIVPLHFASRTKKGVLGVFQWSRTWCEATCRGGWRGAPQAFAFERADEAAAFQAAMATAFART